MQDIIIGICKELESHWAEFIFHQHASHVVRTLFNVLAGNSLEGDVKMRSKKSKKYNQNHDNSWKVRWI
jgi:hypothetical protein